MIGLNILEPKNAKIGYSFRESTSIWVLTSFEGVNSQILKTLFLPIFMMFVHVLQLQPTHPQSSKLVKISLVSVLQKCFILFFSKMLLSNKFRDLSQN